MKVLLIDDERNALNYFESMLRPYEDIQIIGKYTDIEPALQQLKQQEIDLIFLDIELGTENGIEVAEKLVGLYPKLEIVFVTAYHKFAVDAFEINVVDYLLKPVNSKRLKVTIQRVREKLAGSEKQSAPLALSTQQYYAKTFGKFHLFDEQKEVLKWRTRKGKELIALLWRNRDIPVAKEDIIDKLWPNMPYDNAVILLYTTIYQTRKVLKRKAMYNPIKLVGEDYVLQIEISSDLEEFKQIISAPKTSEMIKRSLELYQGNFMQEYDWAISKRQLLENTYLNYLNTCIFNEEINIETSLRQVCLNKVYEIAKRNDNTLLTAEDKKVDRYAAEKEYKKQLVALNLHIPSTSNSSTKK